MTVEDQIGYLQSKIASLEAKLASLESRGENPITEGRLHTTPQPSVDPKGRKIWEAEWRGDYKVMMAYVPDNALIIDGENVEVEADDKEGDEVTLSDGSWYLHAYKNKTTGNWEAELDQEPTGTREDEEAKYNIHICDIHEDGYIEKQYVVGSIVMNAKPSIVGETDDSEKIDGDVEVSGKLDQADNGTSCGIEFKTVSAREAQGTDPERPPRLIADIKGRHYEENGCDAETWGCHKLTIKGKDEDKIIHFLGCDDAIVVGEDGGSGGGGAENVIGSDYIKVEDEEDEDDDGNVTTKRKVSAKIQTSDPNPSSPVEHALLTHDTDQFVRSKKTFLGSSPLANSKKVIVDGPNGKVEVQNEDGNRIIKLDAADIPNECGQGGAVTIQVRKLTVTHPRAKNGKTADIYHVIGCANIEVQEGDAIQSITSGTPTQSGGFTVTPVTITLKDGTSLPAFNVSAKNGEQGTPGSPGDDGEDASVQISTQDIVPTQQDPRTGKTVTITPYTGETAGTPVSFNIYDGEDGGVVGSIIGTASGSQSLNGQITARAKQGSGLVVKTTRTTGPSASRPLADGNLEIDLAGRENLDGCQKNFGLHQLKYKDKDGNTQIYHVLSCGDIDLTKEGKLIKNTSVHISANPGGQNTIVFTYTDGSQDTFSIANGLNGSPGTPGEDGDTPEIKSERHGSHVYIYADGDLIADIEDGHTPQITAQRTGTKQTTIYANGIAIAVINDGEDGQGGSGGEPVEQTFISDISFSVSNGKIIANVTKKKGKFIEVTDAGTENIDVVSGTELDVVTDSGYNTPNLTVTRKKVTVINIGTQSSKTVFTATPLSQE